MNMSEVLSGRKIQPGSQKFGKPAHDKLLSVIDSHYSHAEVIAEPRFLKKLGFWALVPDFAITVGGKTVFLEIKRQGSQGNAHERLYKAFTPKIMRSVVSTLGASEYPVYAVLCDELAVNIRYKREIEQRLEQENYLLWVDYDPNILVEFLDRVFSGNGYFCLDSLDR